MKKAFLHLSIAGIAAATAFLSCNKNYNSGAGSAIPVSTTAPSLNKLFSAFKSIPQTLSVTAGRDTIVYGAGGTMLHFYNNSFKDANGNIITSGTINLQLIEMYKPGDMIRNRATTMANGQILQSGGQITMTATLNGTQVFANAYGIGYKHGNSSAAPMSLFYGATGNADSVATWVQCDTAQTGTTAGGTTTVVDSSLSGTSVTSYFYFDTCTSFTWANCDWFYTNDSTETSVTVTLPDTSFNATNTQIYLVLPDVNRWGITTDTFTAVLSNAEMGGLGSGSYNAATNTMKLLSEGNSNIVPAGLTYKLVIIANKNGAYYYYEQQGTIPHNGLIANAALVTATQSTITANLAGL